MKFIFLINQFLIVLLQSYNGVEDEEFNLFLFSILILAIIAVCICVFIGVILTILLLVLLFILISFGALSGSILVGLNKKSFSAGFKTFVVLFSVASCTVVAGLSFWLLNKVLHWWSDELAICIGLVSGLLGGLAMGFSVAYVIQKVTSAIKSKYAKIKNQ